MANSLRATSILITSQHLFEMEAIANQLFLLHEGRGAFLGDTRLLAERRKSNNYEIAIDADEETVRAALRSLNITSLRHYTTHYQVEAPLGVERGQILAALSKLPMAVSYFRDISNSSRPLMVGSTWLS
jgi:ABC-type multidrug transport system ATPase subunit